MTSLAAADHEEEKEGGGKEKQRNLHPSEDKLEGG